MLPNKNVFCNTPWYEIHIYWDGSYGICCQESEKLHNNDKQYNIKNMSLTEWFNSEPARKFRLTMFDNQMSNICSSCWHQEQHNGNSRRIRGNQKSVIFMSAFNDSFTQSPGFIHFEHSKDHHGYTDTYPIDLHIDLGNYCNLACKMCSAQASSTIASQHVKWNIVSDRKYLGQNWTQDQTTWNSFKQQLLNIPNINNIHFMGGETLLTDRFDDLVDTMIQHQRFDLCFSFVTNGTVYKPGLIEKLKQFRRVGIEISMETADSVNEYVRQGTNNSLVFDNIQKFVSHCNNSSITVTLRPAPSLLTIGSHISMLEYALENKLLIKATFCTSPEFLDIRYLPMDVKKLYLEKYKKFIHKLPADSNKNFSSSDPNYYRQTLYNHTSTCINILNTDNPADTLQKHRELVEHCRRWDKVYKLDARSTHPELMELWDRYDY